MVIQLKSFAKNVFHQNKLQIINPSLPHKSLFPQVKPNPQDPQKKEFGLVIDPPLMVFPASFKIAKIHGFSPSLPQDFFHLFEVFKTLCRLFILVG